jgi:hypothetical protein
MDAMATIEIPCARSEQASARGLRFAQLQRRAAELRERLGGGGGGNTDDDGLVMFTYIVLQARCADDVTGPG